MTRTIRRLACLLAAAGVAGAGGCGGEAVAKAKTALRGRLVVNHKPLHAGTVAAYRAGSKAAETAVHADGRFEFFDLPAGEYQLALTGTDTNTPYGRGVKLPAKYADPGQSGLTASPAGPDDPPREFALTAGR